MSDLYSQMYDYAIDMWAMSSQMVELFTLKPLFQGNSEAGMILNLQCFRHPNGKYMVWGGGTLSCGYDQLSVSRVSWYAVF